MFFSHVKLCFQSLIYIVYSEKAHREKKSSAQTGNTDEVQDILWLNRCFLGLALFLSLFPCVGNSDFVMEGKGEAWNA